MWLSEEQGEVGGSLTDSLPLVVHGGAVPADSEIALPGSRKKERELGWFLFCQASPACLELRVFRMWKEERKL